MNQPEFDNLEDALIAIAASRDEIPQVVISGSSTKFLAHNTVTGYSAIDYHRPDNARLRELSVLLAAHCDLDESDRFYAGLHRDMIKVISPGTDIIFRGDGASFLGARTPPDVDILPVDAASGPPPNLQVLVAFGDSFTYGEEIDLHELGRDDAAYRTERAYPNLLARELDIAEVDNRGERGASNAQIMRNVCDFVSGHRHDLARHFFVISFTHPSRKAFVMRNGRVGRFISDAAGIVPPILRAVCMRAFFAMEDDPEANESVNRELLHKVTMISAFMRRLGCRFVIFPTWNFAASDSYFRNQRLEKEAAFSLGQRGAFGMKDLVSHLPMGPGGHPLNQGHAYFARELAAFIREHDLC